MQAVNFFAIGLFPLVQRKPSSRRLLIRSGKAQFEALRFPLDRLGEIPQFSIRGGYTKR